MYFMLSRNVISGSGAETKEETRADIGGQAWFRVNGNIRAAVTPIVSNKVRYG